MIYLACVFQVILEVSSTLCRKFVNLEEPIVTLDPVLSHQARVQLQDVILEKVLVDFRVEIWFLAHQFCEPFEASLTVLSKDPIFGQAFPDLNQTKELNFI